MNSKGGKEPKMKKLLKSKKALSPVVAAIILIAVTVAVSIAVAAWMGSMTFTFMETEQITITGVVFTETVADAKDEITVTLINTGTTDITLSGATVTSMTGIITLDITAIGQGTAAQTVVLTLATDTWTAGDPYTIELVTSKGNRFSYTDTA